MKTLEENFNIFLDAPSGKWKGNYFPEPEGIYYTQTSKDDPNLKAIETAKSTALEIVNPEVAVDYDADGMILQGGIKAVPGELYPWDGEVEYCPKPEPKKETYGYVPASLEQQGGWCIAGGEEAYDNAFIEWQTSKGVFKLLPKQKEHDPNSVKITIKDDGRHRSMPKQKETHFLEKEPHYIDFDKPNIFIDGDFNDSYEARVRRAGKKTKKYTGAGDDYPVMPKGGGIVATGVQEQGSLKPGQPFEWDGDPLRFNLMQEEIDSLRDQLAKAKEEKDMLFEWKDSMMKLWGPIIDFMQDSKNSKALGLRLGDSLTEKILEMLKNKVG